MNSPDHRSYRPEDSLQQPQPSETRWEEQQAPLVTDAPPLRADQYDPVWEEQKPQSQSDLAQSELDRLEQIITSENFRIRQRRFPNFAPLPPPPPVVRKSAGAFRWTVGTFAFLLATSSLVALHVSGRLPLPEEWADTLSDPGTLVASLFAPAVEEPVRSEAAPATLPPPRLVVNGANAENNEEILVGVGVDSPREGVAAVISGLAQGTTLSAGKPWGATGWIVPASELATTMLRPPAGFVGTMEYSVALQLGDSTVVDRQSMRLEWAPQVTQSPPPSPQTPPQQAAAREIDPEEIASMVKRGEELLGTGDIASARLLLRRAAEARDARAAFVLAASYDPIVLNRLRVHGSTPDVTAARDWYEKAKQYGSREAPQRLELLASQYR